MVKGDSRYEIYDKDGNFLTVLIGATEEQAKEHLVDFCPPGCTMTVGKCRGRC